MTTSHDARTPPTQVYAWGSNEFGQLGVGDLTNNRVSAGLTLELEGNVVAIEAGAHSVYAVCDDGSVWAWGDNSEGQLGDRTRISRSTPRKIPGLTDVVAVAAWDAAYALKSDGSVWAWGNHSAEQVRNPELAKRILTSMAPTRLDSLDGIVAIAASHQAAFALRADGKVRSWGGYEYGELGAGPMDVRRHFTASFVQEANSGGRPIDTTALSGFERLVAVHGKAASVPIADCKAIAAGFQSAYALSHNGMVWAWGSNAFGQLGYGTVSAVPAIVEVQAALARGESFPKWPAADRVAGLTDAIAITSKGLSAYALRRDGTVWAWGANDLGQLGIGTIKDPHEGGGLDQRRIAQAVPGLTGVTAISASGDSVYALHLDGRVSAWGDNRNNELGNGRPGVEPTPTIVSGLGTTRAIAAGLDFAVAVMVAPQADANPEAKERRKSGCYVATAVYGSYDSPQVQSLRRFRDEKLAISSPGRVFIGAYYRVSPLIVRLLSRAPALNRPVRRALDRLVRALDAGAR